MSAFFEMHRSLGASVTFAYAASISATVVLGALLQRARIAGGPAAVALIVGAVTVAAAAWMWPPARPAHFREFAGSAVPLVVGAVLPIVSAYLALVTLKRRSLAVRLAAGFAAGTVAAVLAPLTSLSLACALLGDCL
jgi:hypothetical protein